MFDFPNFDAHPPRENNSSSTEVVSAFEAFLDAAMRKIEIDAHDERTRAMAGLARRHSDVKKALNNVLRFADPGLTETVPIETVLAANTALDDVLKPLTHFLDTHPTPEHTNFD